MDDFRKLLHRAQAAEVKGDYVEAIACLQRAAALCEEAGLEAKAQKMLRHRARLQARVGPPPAPVAPRGPVCALCREVAEGGWQAEGGLWLCGACLQKAQGAVGMGQ